MLAPAPRTLSAPPAARADLLAQLARLVLGIGFGFGFAFVWSPPAHAAPPGDRPAARSPKRPAKLAQRRKRSPNPGRDIPLSYRLSIPAPHTRYVEVHLEVPASPSPQTTLAMPAWAPGSYLIRDFGRHVYDFEAHAHAGAHAESGHPGAALKVTRVDKQRWQVDNDGEGFSVDYRVFADELSVRTSYVDDHFALLNGTSVFMYVDGRGGHPRAGAITVAVEAPREWTVHTSLATSPASTGAPSPGAPTFVAPDYDTLVDSPLLLGKPRVARFVVAGAEIEFVFLAPAGSNAALPRIVADTEKIVRAYARTFNGLPFERYVFLMLADQAGGGGLEHFDSTALIVRPWIFDTEAGYRRVQRLIAHEFFHLWNVKRIHDQVLGPFDYSRENYSELLWFHEGFTETMETRALLRAGLVDPEAYLEGLGKAWTAYLRKPGRNYDPIAALSREAWIKSYKPAPNHAETTISYYEKGNLIGVCLDLSLRLRARDHARTGSLDGLFRRLWAARDPDLGRASITLDHIVDAASAEAGEDMRWFFDAYVLGTRELPLEALLREAGFEVEGETVDPIEDPRAAAWTGMSGGTAVTFIDPSSPAAAAGVMLGDEPIAVDGLRVRSVGEAKARLSERKLGAPTSLSLFRRGRLELVEVRTIPNPHRSWQFSNPDTDTGPHARLRALWLDTHLER